MIFVSLGTMDMPFFRMAQAVDDWAATADEPVVVQAGYTRYNFRHARSFDFCTKDEMRRYLNEASILVLQGGWGAISEAMELGKRIVVMPRREGAEHIHDQSQLVRKLDALGCILGVFDEADLSKKICQARTFPFQQLPKGHAEPIIEAKLQEWFSLPNSSHPSL